MSEKRYGMRKEDQLADYLEGRGARVQLSPGSEGAADLKASWPGGPKWHIQVKASRSRGPAQPSNRELGRLKQGATRAGATPVVAAITGNRVVFYSARDGRPLRPPRK